ncbi:MAG TPA: ATP-binding protein [Wenzhouxiangella sp.]
MLSKPKFQFERDLGKVLLDRLQGSRRWIQLVTGARQVGKTTLIQQVLHQLETDQPWPVHYISADAQATQGETWLRTQWENARLSANQAGSAVLAIDEIQKIPQWSEWVKRLWDEDTMADRNLKVVLLGSAPLLLQDGLTESLAGRFERLHLPHWSFPEMAQAFGYTLDDYIFFGGYPGASALKSEPDRWRAYVLESLVETTVTRDILLMTRIHKPALMRQLFDLGCHYSGQILSYTKMLGQLQEAGNTTTLAHYLELLSAAGMLAGIQKYAGTAQRQRASSPKFQVFNTGLMSAVSGQTPQTAQADRSFYGRLVESAVGAHLINAMACGQCDVFYWRQGDQEVDFVVCSNKRVLGIEVKTTANDSISGMRAFEQAHHPDKLLLVGPSGVALDKFLSVPVSSWLD